MSETENAAVLAARAKLAAKYGQVRTGGKGSVRRKKKVAQKSASTDDKRFILTLKKLGVNPIPQIEEVNLFNEDGTVTHFKKPRVHASAPAATYVVSGASETKKVEEMLPEIMSSLNQGDMEQLKKLAEMMKKNGGEAPAVEEIGGDDEVPDLVDNFEAVSEQAEDLD